jgi:flagellar biosynthetic protein FlhB
MSGEKTEKATPKKRKDARKEGQVFKSVELVNAFSLIAILIVFKLFSASSGTSLMTYMQTSLDIADAGQMPSATVFAETFVWVLAPFLIICLLVGVAVNYAQVGLLLVGKNAMPKLERINPVEGARRIFSRKTLFAGVKTVVKLTVIALLGWRSVRSAMNRVPLLTELPLVNSLRITLDLVVSAGANLAAALAVIGIADYIFERLEHENRLKMTKQEVKDEYKKTEGAPVIKSNIRSRQIRMARLRMMHSVPKADAVIVNPTHYAWPSGTRWARAERRWWWPKASTASPSRFERSPRKTACTSLKTRNWPGRSTPGWKSDRPYRPNITGLWPRSWPTCTE